MMARTKPPTTKARGGRGTVTYVDARGYSHDAVVTGAGSGATLNLRVGDLPAANRLKSNVAKRTAVNSTDCWW